MALPEPDSATVRLLAELGFIMLMRGQPLAAGILMDAVLAARPACEAGLIGKAMVMLGRGEVDDAVVLLSRVPPSDAASTFLGIALLRQGNRDSARRILTGVCRMPVDEAPARLARQVLAELDAG